MRRTSVVAQAGMSRTLPRGWIVLGMIVSSWMLMAALWVATSQVFASVAATI
jgi:hypothetical protein